MLALAEVKPVKQTNDLKVRAELNEKIEKLTYDNTRL
jgi:hypothetical protein